MASTDARPIPQKNVAYRITFPIFDADGDLVTGATGLDSEVSKDGGTFADCTNEATEIATSSGMYYLDLTSTEMNADTVAVIVKTTSSGAKTTPIVLYPEEAGDVRVNVTQVNGTTQTARDLGASVLISSGTGTGQLDVTSGVIKANLAQILGTALTETAGQIAAAFKQFFDVASPTGTMKAITNVVTTTNLTTNNDKTGYSLSSAGIQAIWDALTSALTTVGSIGKRLVDYLTGDIYARLGAPAGASVSADIAAVNAKTTNLPASPAAVGSAMTLASGAITAAVIATDAIDSDAIAASAVTEIQSGLSTLDAAGIRSAVGLASANLDTQLTTINGFLDTEVAAIKAKTDNLPASPASTSDVLTQVNAALDAASTELTAVPTTTGSLRQFIQFLHAYFRNKKTQTSTTETLYKEDASTSLGTSTLSDNGTTASKGEMN